ncbi:GTPase-associated system all-helical protein GASH [Pseudomonas sp. WHRI 8519]|uniref:GTPase-associated system all-helical protein GASH n=1 Tax=Pseudomonas sp. WHRI 8519 TaxID=3162567 RepID=UPI0032ECDF8A
MSVAKHIRLIDPAPTDDFVSKREAAIKALRIKFLKVKTVSDLLRLGSTLSLGCFGQSDIPEDILESIASALVKESPAFDPEENPQEIKLIGILALLDAIENGGNADKWAIADVLAVAAWSTLSFIPPLEEPKLDVLRCEVIEKARNRALKTAITTRDRSPVPDVDKLVVDPGATELPVVLTSTIEALRRNAALDREELDLLWWVIADGSDILQKPLSAVPGQTRAIISGFEVGSMLRRLPSQAHNHLVQRNITATETLSLIEVIEILGDDRLKISHSFANAAAVTQAPHMFPVLTAIRSGKAQGIAAEMKRSLNEWALRTLLESSVLRLQYSDNGKL